MNTLPQWLLPTLTQALNNLSHILQKGADHAAARGIDETVLTSARLFPDMLPLSRQVGIACDIAKFAVGRLSGTTPPKHEDTQTRFEELRQRVQEVLDYIASVDPNTLEGGEARTVTLTLRGQPVNFQGLAYVQHFVLPNVFFHSTTTYNLLRHNGVELGKMDFLGKVT